MWSYVGVGCVLKQSPTGVTVSSCWLPKGRGRDEMRSCLFSLRFKGVVPASSSPHLIISEQNSLLAVSNAKKKEKKTRFRCKAKLPIRMQEKQNKKKKQDKKRAEAASCLSALFQEITAAVCNHLLFKCWLERETDMNPRCKYLTCASKHQRTVILLSDDLLGWSSRSIKAAVISGFPQNQTLVGN